MINEIALPVTAIQRFCMHDGDGIRTTVFLKGCSLKCKWCHNPEARTSAPILMYGEKSCISCTACGVCPNGSHTFEDGLHRFNREKCVGCFACADVCPTGALRKSHTDMTFSEITNAVLRDKVFYTGGGGVTLSGGEPLFHGEKTVRLLEKMKEAGLNTAVETCGSFGKELIYLLPHCVDTLLWDIKDTNPARLAENTGASFDKILSNLELADSVGIPTVLRCIILDGINFTKEHIDSVLKIRDKLDFCKKIELIAYHPMGSAKCLECGVDSSFHDKKYVPCAEKLMKARLYVDGKGDFE